MLDRAVGPNVIRGLLHDMAEFLDRNASRGWSTLEDFRGLSRSRIVPQSQIARPGASEYHGGREAEGYAESDEAHVRVP
jgi:hypothetical protein